jgi:hypothetical protein
VDEFEKATYDEGCKLFLATNRELGYDFAWRMQHLCQTALWPPETRKRCHCAEVLLDMLPPEAFK